ncbi:hypothetical protein F511_45953 [Dorcoceras hygrometricum]|uniref:Uncharacterized protein n=1 Tax=Dorcoceras hygrometricum TaxID=472368 RepID=A0A2Z6ZUT5_9LAMI|nr:hypothetical protein F511_45953 [Dorcoceras hygrometricum]
MRAGRAWWPAMASSRAHFVARWPRLSADAGRRFAVQSVAAMEGARWLVMLRKLLRTLADRMLPLARCWSTLAGRLLRDDARLPRDVARGRASRLAWRCAAAAERFFVVAAAAPAMLRRRRDG